MFIPKGTSDNLILAELSRIVSLTLPRLELILQNYTNILEAIEDNFTKIDLVKNVWLEKFLENKENFNPSKLEEILLKEKVGVLTILDGDYPLEWKNLPNPPVLIYFQGNIELLKNKNKLTVVGSRNISNYSVQVMNKILPNICKLEAVIISGLALGVDSLSHKLALQYGAKTIGIIGSGLDDLSFYPTENLSLKKEILENEGLVISEYFLGEKPLNYHFPARNRLLASLSKVVWIVQAGQKSGSLITAKLAYELGKTVATTPYSIFDFNFGGNLRLLQEGANIIADSEDLMTLLNLVGNNHSQNDEVIKVNFGSLEEQKVYQTLTFSPIHIDELVKITEIEIQFLQTILTMLELKGIVINLGENNWVKQI